MKTRPILLNGDMVRAVLNGSKTQTRRVIKNVLGNNHIPYTFYSEKWGKKVKGSNHVLDKKSLSCCPFGQVGDLIWVRETFGVFDSDHQTPSCKCYYKADTLDGSDGDDIRKAYGYKYKPSIHMPRWASRITLEITCVRVERLQDISEEDAKAEGVQKNCSMIGDNKCPACVNGCVAEGEYIKYPLAKYENDFPAFSAKESFESLWDSIYGTWEQNPWVWVIEFKVVQ